MFIAWSDADTNWVEEIEIVSSFECEYVFNPLGGLSWGMQRLYSFTFPSRVERKSLCYKMSKRLLFYQISYFLILVDLLHFWKTNIFYRTMLKNGFCVIFLYVQSMSYIWKFTNYWKFNFDSVKTLSLLSDI